MTEYVRQGMPEETEWEERERRILEEQQISAWCRAKQQAWDFHIRRVQDVTYVIGNIDWRVRERLWYGTLRQVETYIGDRSKGCILRYLRSRS